MGYIWDMSKGNDDNKVNISPVTNRLYKSARIIIPALLISSVALADDVPGKAGEAAKAVSKASKTKKRVEFFKKTTGVAVTGQTCLKALEKGVENRKSGNPVIDAMTLALAITCGYLIAMAQLTFEED